MELTFEILKILAPFGAAFVAYLLGSRAYFRQKEFELVRSRYLEEGIDCVAARAEEAMSLAAHNLQHAFKVLRVFRDVGPDRAVQMCEGFKGLEAGSLELVAVTRLNELVQDGIFWEVRQLLYSEVQENHTLAADDMCGAMRAIANGAGLKVSKADFLRTYEQKLMEGYCRSSRFSLLVSALHEIASALQAERLTLVAVKNFSKKEVVTREIDRLKSEFGPDIKPLDQQLERLGIELKVPTLEAHNTAAPTDQKAPLSGR